MTSFSNFRFLLLIPVFFTKIISAHEHHETSEIMNDEAFQAPIDGILLAHIAFMFLAFGIIYPTGMELALSCPDNWFYFSPQSVIFLIMDMVEENSLVTIFTVYLHLSSFIQVGIGAYLKLHLTSGPNKWFRPLFTKVHKIVGILIPILGYAQMVFGVITSCGWCRGENVEQSMSCTFHYGFFIYRIWYLFNFVLRLASGWLQRKGKSQDYYDRILWYAGGTVGVYLSRNGKRNIMPALIILFTGYAMSSHAQASEISTKIHAMFGYVLMSASVMLIFAGLLFMGATVEQIASLTQLGIDPFSYTLVLASTAFLIFFYAYVLINLYCRSGQNDDPHTSSSNSEDGHEVLFQRAKSNDDDYEFHNLLNKA
ncbi:putative Integral membrane protein Ytp1 [Gigaspora margarita]|uniref:Putative Integral membrane protein Ytp1 n=1 Tax=Gigaspora margarita TaxID=4874 RepID=A0A8H4A2N9_GIGMA|nr:putative Integral membrane protein Ytp1 [Gigaspora margarita]